MADTVSAPAAPTADHVLRAAVGLAAIAVAVLERGVLGVDDQSERFTGPELAGTNVNPEAKRLSYEVEQARFVVEHLPDLIGELRLVASHEGAHPAAPEGP